MFIVYAYVDITISVLNVFKGDPCWYYVIYKNFPKKYDSWTNFKVRKVIYIIEQILLTYLGSKAPLLG